MAAWGVNMRSVLLDQVGQDLLGYFTHRYNYITTFGERVMTVVPKWYLPVTIIALVWNLLGCLAYLSDVMLTPDDIAKMSAEQQALYASRATWAVAATAIAVWFGAAGSVGLIIRQRWALPVLIVSLAGLIVQDFGLFVLTNAASQAGPVVFVIQGMVLLVAVGLVILARRAISQGWIPRQTPPKE
jgi:hypothetical protein